MQIYIIIILHQSQIHFKIRKNLAGGWGYDSDSSEELTVLPRQFAALGVGRERS